MKFKLIIKAILLLVLLFFAASCINTSRQESTNDSTPSSEAVDGGSTEPQIIIEMDPALPQASQEELIVIWKPALGSFTLIGGLCEIIMESGLEEIESSGFDVLGDRLGTLLLMSVIEEVLLKWDPAPAVYAYREDGLDRIYTLGGLLDQMDSGEISRDLFHTQIEAECQSIEITFEEMIRAAEFGGLTQSSMEVIFDELVESFIDIETEIMDLDS